MIMELSTKYIERWDIRDKDAMYIKDFLVREIFFDCESNKEIISLVVAIFEDRNNLDNDKLRDEISNLDYRELHWKVWDRIRILMIVNGLMLISHYFRNLAVKSLNTAQDGQFLVRRFSNALEDLDIKKMKNLVKEFEKNALDASAERRVISLLEGKYKLQDSYGELVKDKRVIVCGPAYSQNYDWDYDRESDIVISMTYKGNNIDIGNGNTIFVDVSYYNYHSTQVMEKSILEYSKELEYICTKKELESKANIRMIECVERGITFGNLLLGTIVIFDLLNYNPKEIYIANYDLYSSGVPYNEKYVEKGKNENRKNTSLAIHDIEGQFNLMKALYNNNYFSCDRQLELILNLENVDYMKLMDRY